MKIKVKEKELQKAILDYLKLKGAVAVKFNNVGIFIPGSGKYIPPREKGISDILACYKGSFLAIEVKGTDGKPTPEQLDFIDRVNKVGGYGIWVNNIDQVINLIEKTVFLKDLI